MIGHEVDRMFLLVAKDDHLRFLVIVDTLWSVHASDLAVAVDRVFATTGATSRGDTRISREILSNAIVL